jgi:hypothetical protein
MIKKHKKQCKDKLLPNIASPCRHWQPFDLSLIIKKMKTIRCPAKCHRPKAVSFLCQLPLSAIG